ncbi:MAG: DUF2812 domain-containing protein [Lachnospiraceae bacterium]|jgi:hypothetical protein
MRKVIHKAYMIWNFDKEEKWLNEMAAKGLTLVSAGFCRYEFEETLPGEYTVRLELLKNSPVHPESTAYLEFLEETGIEYVGKCLSWVYLRKRKADGGFELYSDNDSRIKYLNRILRLALIVGIANFFIGADNLFLCFSFDSTINAMGLINVCLGFFCLYGIVKLYKKRKKLMAEQLLYE